MKCAMLIFSNEYLEQSLRFLDDQRDDLILVVGVMFKILDSEQMLLLEYPKKIRLLQECMYQPSYAGLDET